VLLLTNVVTDMESIMPSAANRRRRRKKQNPMRVKLDKGSRSHECSPVGAGSALQEFLRFCLLTIQLILEQTNRQLTLAADIVFIVAVTVCRRSRLLNHLSQRFLAFFSVPPWQRPLTPLNSGNPV